MIKKVKGIYEMNYGNGIIIDTGMGLSIFVNIPKSSPIYLNNIGDNISVFTEMVVKENDISLYGFHNIESLELFNLLNTVSGIGPKGAMSILDLMSLDELKMAISSGDSKTISKANGIGKKTAERVVLELHDKVDIDNVKNVQTIKVDEERLEAINALVSLGYSNLEAKNAVSLIKEEGLTTDKYIKLALKNLL